MRVYLACFDIENNRKRRQLGDLLLTYGDRVQHSVFEISLKNETEFNQLCQQCEGYVTEHDSLRFYWLNKESRSQSRDVWGEPIAVFPAAVLL